MNNPLDTNLFDRAAQMAIKAHCGTERRGKGFPYIIHPMEAASIVATITSDQELLAAAVLHDTVEDTDVTIEEIRSEFGDRVARLVQHETGPLNESIPWRDKKQAQIDQLEMADHDCKIVALGDKLSNMRGLANDYRMIGDKLWSRFHAPNGKKDIEWYYRSIAGALFELAETAPYQEFVSLLDDTFGEMDFTEAVKVDLANYEESGGGYMATSYNDRKGFTMVKFYNTYIDKELPVRELQTAHAVFRMGIPTPMPGRLVTDGERYGAEFRRINPKESFARYVSNRPDSYEEIALRFARMCRQLHATPCNTTIFGPEKEHSLETVARCPHLSDSNKARISQFIENVEEKSTCLHGDMHIGNVITTALPERETVQTGVATHDFWIDMGDFRWGNPLYDLGMFYLVCNYNNEDLTQRLFHVSVEMMHKIWNVFIREYYPNITTDAEQAEIEERLKPFAALKLIYYGTVDKMYPPMMDFIRRAYQL